MKLLTACFQGPCLTSGMCKGEIASTATLFIPGTWSVLSVDSSKWYSGGQRASRQQWCLTWELAGHSAQGNRWWLKWHWAFFQENQPICCVSLFWFLEPSQGVLNNKVLGIPFQWIIQRCDFPFLPHLVQHNGGKDLGDAGNSIKEQMFMEIKHSKPMIWGEYVITQLIYCL